VTTLPLAELCEDTMKISRVCMKTVVQKTTQLRVAAMFATVSASVEGVKLAATCGYPGHRVACLFIASWTGHMLAAMLV
jgi:hypothetical protein